MLKHLKTVVKRFSCSIDSQPQSVCAVCAPSLKQTTPTVTGQNSYV